MNITIKLIYLSHGIRVMRGGSFRVNYKQFQEDPEKTAAHATLQWIREIKREMSVEEILEVVFDGNKNITEKVLEIEKALLED